MQFLNAITRPQLADTTSSREGAALVGTDTKTNLNNATDVETALTYLDTFVSDTATSLSGAADLVGFNDWRPLQQDPFTIRSNYGLTVTRQGDIYYLDWLPSGGAFTINGGQGITVVISGTDITIHQRETRVSLTDSSAVTADCSNDNNFRLNMGSGTGTRSITFSNASVGQKFSLLLKQIGGSALLTYTDTILWPGGTGPTLTSSNNHGDLLAFECVSSGVFLGFIVAQNFDLSAI